MFRHYRMAPPCTKLSKAYYMDTYKMTEYSCIYIFFELYK